MDLGERADLGPPESPTLPPLSLSAASGSSFGQLPLPLPSVEQNSPFGFDGHSNGHMMPPLPPETPAISQMLAKEGTAWAALLSLHSGVISAARSAAAQSEENALLGFDEPADNSDAREAAYIASLTRLASACDDLFSEAIKLRGLRRAQRHFKLREIEAVTRRHRDETLAVGCDLARKSALSLSEAAAELRQMVSRQRAEVDQLKDLLHALSHGVRLPEDCEIVVGLRARDASASGGGPHVLQTVGEATQLAAAHGGGTITPEALVAALRRLPPPAAYHAGRRFQRRAHARPDD